MLKVSRHMNSVLRDAIGLLHKMNILFIVYAHIWAGVNVNMTEVRRRGRPKIAAEPTAQKGASGAGEGA